MRRDLFTADHESFREMARDFVAKEVAPHYASWEEAGRLPRELFIRLGALGVLGMAIPEEYGGAGLRDYRYNVVLQEEAARALVTLGTVRTQLDVILPYFLAYAGQGRRPLPAAVRRLRLRQRLPDRPALHRRPHHPHLRRHERGDEGDHREVSWPVNPLHRKEW